VFFGAVLVPMYTNWAHISQFQIQILQSWFMLWIFLLEIPTGVVADYLGRKYSLAMAGLVTAIATLVYGSVPLFGVFLAAEFLYAMGAALSSGADDALLYDALKEEGRENESKKIFGRANTIHLAGIFLAAPIGSLMAQKFGVNSPMLFSAIPMLLCFLVALSIKEPKVHDKTPERKRYLLIAKKRNFVFCPSPGFEIIGAGRSASGSGSLFCNLVLSADTDEIRPADLLVWVYSGGTGRSRNACILQLYPAGEVDRRS